jgi:hypothetical protein
MTQMPAKPHVLLDGRVPDFGLQLAQFAAEALPR